MSRWNVVLKTRPAGSRSYKPERKMDDAACHNLLTSLSWCGRYFRRSGRSQAAATWKEPSVAPGTRQQFWARVRRVDGCLDAIAMAPQLKLRGSGWRSSRGDLNCGKATLQICPSGLRREAAMGC